MFIHYHDGDSVETLGHYEGSIKQDTEEMNRNMILHYDHHLEQIRLATVIDSKEVTISTVRAFQLPSLLQSDL